MVDDVYILIPGITGSILQKDGRDVFGLSVSAGLRALFSAGSSIHDLRLDPSAPPGERPNDGVTAARLSPDAHLIPGLWKIDGYGKVADYLVRRMRAIPGKTLVEFPYDWRLDNRIAAADLKSRVDQSLMERRRTHPHAKAVLVSHSMGGLVSRYFTEVLGGWRDTRAIVAFGTPHRGSLNALDTLVNGTKALGLVDLSDLVRSFPSSYQLLPTYRCLDIGNPELAYIADAAPQVPNLNPEAVNAARAFHQEIAAAVRENRQLEEYHRSGYQIHGVVGIDQPTAQSARLTRTGVQILQDYQSTNHGGDGTVPRVSASPVEAQDDSTSMFAGTRHGSLQNADAVLTQLRGWLTGVDLRSFRAGAPVRLSLAIQDVYPSDEPVHGTVTPSAATSEIRYELEMLTRPADPTAATAPPSYGTLAVVDGPREFEITPRGPGCYRLTLTGSIEVEPVSDLLVVAPR
jgi:hypothetical protein